VPWALLPAGYGPAITPLRSGSSRRRGGGPRDL